MMIQWPSEASLSSSSSSEDSFSLVIVRCHGNITWITQVPEDWSVTVYEKCEDVAVAKETVFRNTGRSNVNHTTAFRLGAEECNGYLDYIVDNYETLSPITVFMHDDGLYPWSKWRGRGAHTPFANFTQVVQTINKLMLNGSNRTFLHMGVRTLKEGMDENAYHGIALRAIWPLLQGPAVPEPPTEITWKPSAHFAVRPEAIRVRPKYVYEALLLHARYGWQTYGTSRKFCCGLEVTWPIVFGFTELEADNMAFDLLRKDGQLLDYPVDKKWNGTHYVDARR